MSDRARAFLFLFVAIEIGTACATMGFYTRREDPRPDRHYRAPEASIARGPYLDLYFSTYERSETLVGCGLCGIPFIPRFELCSKEVVNRPLTLMIRPMMKTARRFSVDVKKIRLSDGSREYEPADFMVLLRSEGDRSPPTPINLKPDPRLSNSESWWVTLDAELYLDVYFDVSAASVEVARFRFPPVRVDEQSEMLIPDFELERFTGCFYEPDYMSLCLHPPPASRPRCVLP